MKIKAVFILALLAFSVIAEEGVTSDDWHEDTDVEIFESADHEHHRNDDSKTYTLKEGEEFYGSESTVTDGMAALWTNTTESRLEMVDGKLVNVTVIREHRIDKHRKIQKIKAVVHSKVKIDSVLEVVRSFGTEYGHDLSPVELQLFNTIATTHGNEFHMQYIIRQIEHKDLDKTLRKIAKLFSVQLDEDDFAHWANLIAHNCPNKYHVFALNTTDVEINRPDLWTVKTEVLMATCGGENNVGYQLFGWSASKTGSYQRNQYSAENGETIDKLMTRWLYGNMRAMVDCDKSEMVTECELSETETLSQFEPSETSTPPVHVNPGDEWQEHADGGEGSSFTPYEKTPPTIPEESNPDVVIWEKTVPKEESSSSATTVSETSASVKSASETTSSGSGSGSD